MTARHPRTVRHPSLMELAELDEGLLDEPRSAMVEAHVTGCAECTRHRAELRGGRPGAVGRPGPAPAGRGRRPAGHGAGRRGRPAGATAQSLRVAAGDGVDDVSGHVGWIRPTLGRFGDDLPRRSRTPDAGAGAGRGGGGGRGRLRGVRRLGERRAERAAGGGRGEHARAWPPRPARWSGARTWTRTGSPGPGSARGRRPAAGSSPWPAPPSTGPRRCWSTPGRGRPPW